MLRVLAHLQHADNQTTGGHTNVLTPVNQPLWGPLHVGAVRR